MLKMFNKKNTITVDPEVLELRKELENCKFLLNRNDVFFNMAVDESLIESQIYEREALLHQYNYLIKCLREKEKQLRKENDSVVTIGE